MTKVSILQERKEDSSLFSYDLVRNQLNVAAQKAFPRREHFFWIPVQRVESLFR